MADDADTSNDEAYENMSLVDTPMDAQPEAPSVPEEQAATEGSDAEDKTEAAPTEAKDTEATGQEAEPQDQQPEQPVEEKGKPDPELARQAYLERQQTRRAVEAQVEETYSAKTEEQLIEEGLDPQAAQIQALREEMQFERQKTYIAELNAGMQAEAVNVTNDYPVFNPNSKDFDPDFTAMVENQYKVASRLQADENGIILNAEVPLYDFYKSMADIYTKASARGADRGQADALQVLSRAESPGGSSSTNKGPESLEEMEERLGNMPIV